MPQLGYKAAEQEQIDLPGPDPHVETWGSRSLHFQVHYTYKEISPGACTRDWHTTHTGANMCTLLPCAQEQPTLRGKIKIRVWRTSGKVEKFCTLVHLGLFEVPSLWPLHWTRSLFKATNNTHVRTKYKGSFKKRESQRFNWTMWTCESCTKWITISKNQMDSPNPLCALNNADTGTCVSWIPKFPCTIKTERKIANRQKKKKKKERGNSRQFT